VPALQNFFDAERQRRHWSMRETAKKCGISISKAYAIANGDDNVEFDTFENIATAFDMTPAELAVAIGKGPANADPVRAVAEATLRRVPTEHLETVDLVLRTFTPKSRAKPDRSANAGPHRRNKSTKPSADDSGLDNPTRIWWNFARPVVAALA
jgi:transcriptional regulator with XRE-family HTH domain